MRLKHKIAIVTGGATGIGHAIAQRFAIEGATVHVLDRNLPTPTKQKKAHLETIHFHTCDVSNETSIQQVIGSIAPSLPIDILINNAGINHKPASITDTLPSQWRAILLGNLDSVYLVSRAVIPRMNAGSSIINISSVLALAGGKNCAAYSTSKGGVLTLSKSMAKDYAPSIRVNCICPGPVETAMFQEYLERCADAAVERGRIVAEVPMGRLGMPSDIANAALFLASDEAAWITGTALIVDGGDSI